MKYKNITYKHAHLQDKVPSNTANATIAPIVTHRSPSLSYR